MSGVTSGARKYALPGFLDGQTSQERYERWLRNRAQAHVLHDRKRGYKLAIGLEYRAKIHAAVSESQGKDAYTGERLDWKLLGLFNNRSAKLGGHDYLRKFDLLPSVDHYKPGRWPPVFRICGRLTNDAKSSLTEREFVALCKRVIAFSNKRRARRAQRFLE